MQLLSSSSKSSNCGARNLTHVSDCKSLSPFAVSTLRLGPDLGKIIRSEKFASTKQPPLFFILLSPQALNTLMLSKTFSEICLPYSPYYHSLLSSPKFILPGSYFGSQLLNLRIVSKLLTMTCSNRATNNP